MSFRASIERRHDSSLLTREECHEAVQTLLGELSTRIKGQGHVVRRVVQAALLNGHILLEGMPGEGKTALVQGFAERVGLPLPSANDRSRVPFSVYATQNPVELEGTYPLSEAQTDRFLFKVLMDAAPLEAYSDIVRINLPLGTQGPQGDAPAGNGNGDDA